MVIIPITRQLSTIFSSLQLMENLGCYLDRRGYISHINFPQSPGDSIQDFILYKLHFEDTNNDNVLNYADKGQFYISELDGHGLRKISPDSLRIYGYQLALENNAIHFFAKHYNSQIRGEHVDKEIYEYSLKTREWKALREVNAVLRKAASLLN